MSFLAEEGALAAGAILSHLSRAVHPNTNEPRDVLMLGHKTASPRTVQYIKNIVLTPLLRSL